MRRIAAITTSRADYGIQSRLIRMLQDCADVSFSLVVSGTHLSRKHGMTVGEIEGDGIEIASRVDIGIDEETDMAKIMARAIVGFSEALSAIAPDICLLLGDRYEMMAASLACTLLNIPIAHIHGGEATEGAIDEVFRHSITKAAYLHFTSCEAYRQRVIQLGEDPSRVFNVGSLGVENIGYMDMLGREELAEKLGVRFSRRNYLVTFHPATAEQGEAISQIDELLSALGSLQDSTIVFTHPNADAGSDLIAKRIGEFVNERETAYLFKSLGARRYLSMAKCADAVVGNSSSGILEVPSLGTATVNIGDREGGRIRGASVLDCPPRAEAIAAAIAKAVELKQSGGRDAFSNPYYKPDTAKTILDTLRSFDLVGALKKKFHDMDAGQRT